jgi:hypothetical protein
MMKNYNAWMNSSDNSEEIVYGMADKSLIKINNSPTAIESIINDANEWQKDVDLIWLISKSHYTPSFGDFIEYQSNFYLNVFPPEERATYWSSKARLCNSTYPIKLNKTKTLKVDAQGNPVLDKFGDPIYTHSEGTTTYLPCIVESSLFASDENKQLPLSEGQLRITLQYQSVNNIKVNNTFTMYNNTYKIRNIDYTKVINNKGIVLLSVEQVTSEVK